MEFEIKFRCGRAIERDGGANPNEEFEMVSLSACPDCPYYDDCISDGYIENVKAEIAKKIGGAKKRENVITSEDERTQYDAYEDPYEENLPKHVRHGLWNGRLRIAAASELKGIKRSLDKFPGGDQLLPGRPAFLSHEIDGGRWAETIVDHQWGRLLDELTDGLATPDALFFKHIENAVRTVFKDRPGHRSDYSDTFFLAISRAIWKFLSLQTLPGHIDSICSETEQLGHPILKDYERKKIRAIRSNLRKYMGVASKPKKMFSQWSPQQRIDQLKGLAIEIGCLLGVEGVKLNMSSEIIHDLWKKFNIAEIKADTIRTTYLTPRKSTNRG